MINYLKSDIYAHVGFGGSVHSGLFGPTSKYRVYKLGVIGLIGKKRHLELGLGVSYEKLISSVRNDGFLSASIETNNRFLPLVIIGYRSNGDIVLRTGISNEGLYISLGFNF